MRSSALVATALVAGVFASPVARPHYRNHVDKDNVEVQWDFVTVWQTITIIGDAPKKTAAPVFTTTFKAPEVIQTKAPQVIQTKAPEVVYVPEVVDEPYVPEVVEEEPEDTYVPDVVDEPEVEEPKPKPKPSAPEVSYGNDYKGSCLKHHNLHRANHSADPLEWDDGLASTAQKIAKTCVYGHNTKMDGGGYGQNIALGVKPEEISVIISDLFYNNEFELFAPELGKAQPDMSNFKAWGHLTQIVWASTTSVGCATVDCGGIGHFTVCNYKGPGNFAGEYDKNVLPSLGQPMVVGQSL